MSESIAGTYASLAGIEIINDARTFAYLKNGLAPGSVNIYGDCGCPNIQQLVGCSTATEFATIDGANFTGVSGGYIDAPHSFGLSVLGDLYIGVKFRAAALLPVANQDLVAKWVSTGNQRSYRLQLNTAGGLTLSWTADGTTILSRASTVPLPFADGTTIYVYATLDVDNGASGHDVKFYYSTSDITYSPLGAVVTTAGTTSIFNGTAPVELGSQDGGTNNLFIGVIYNAVIRNGIPPLGPVVGSPDFQPNDPAITPASTSITDDQSNVWSRHGTATFLPGTGTQEVFAAYSDPAADNAPWYTTDNPASAGFAGFIVDSFEGMGSPFTRSVKENVGNGGILTRSRLKTRELTWKGFLFGATCCSVQYGLRWLTKTLSRLDASCRDCSGDDLELLVCCPDSGNSASDTVTVWRYGSYSAGYVGEPTTETVAPTVAEVVESPFRLLKGVALLEGPEILSERKTCTSGCSNGCGGSCILEIEFTLVATQPYFYSPPITVYTCVPLYEGSGTPFTESTVDCGPNDCSDYLFGDGGVCPLPVLPPTATYTNNCVDEFTTPRANYYTVSRSLWKENEEVVPVISITSGALAVNQLKLGFYSSTSDNPCGDLSQYPPDCDVVCDELTILSIPPNSTFYIDGRTRKMAIICADGSVFPGERLTSGPWSWPTFDCFGFCMEVIFNEEGANPAEKLACVSISLVPRTF